MKDREAWCAAVNGSQRVRHNGATEQQQISKYCFRLCHDNLSYKANIIGTINIAI